MGRMERGGQVFQQASKRPCQRLRPRDQNIVIAPYPIKRKERRSGSPEAPFGPVALDGPTDFPAGCKAHTHALRLRGRLRRGAKFECHGRGNPSDPFGGTQEIGTGLQPFHDEPRPAGHIGQAESLLRPWARRRARTLRPPLVSMRARKP